MKVSDAERQAIRTVIDLGQRFGYGNMISHLGTAWARHLIACGLDEAAALRHGGERAYPIKLQDDILERGEWDESGARYAKKPTEGHAR